ncbi:hypothetical protein A0U94_05220 [Gluconobacter albidus]|uniref:hypothetical protein n=1 Tax=Gluconobacter albidus TaxID=318683 RepID=UPI00098B9A60|nr:hypothetical protein [Gluconobacter albidus]AQS90457.1 hypothetical protein A0U94_05220 [Gluconobacter albidus]
MAGFDTGANALLGIGQGTVQPADPSEQLSRAIGIRNALLGNKIQQAEYDARMAGGNALLGATDGAGHTDYAKARATMARDPKAAYGAAQAMREQNASRQEDVLNQDEQLAFQNHASEAAANGMGRLVNDPSNANVRGYAAFMKRLTPAASDQINTITNQVLALPTTEQRQEALKAAFTAHMGQEASGRVFGTPTSVDDGQTIQTGTQASSMDGGAFTPAAGVQRQISPETNSSPMDVINPDGSHSYVRRDQVVGGAQGRPTVPPEVMGSGRYPTQQPANPGYQSAPAAGQTAALTETAQAGAQGANALMQASANRNDRMAALGNMSSDLEGFTSGPGSERIRHFASVFDNWTGGNWKSGEIENAQSFNKWAQNLANAQSQALGTGTDSKLAAAVHASPNSALQGSTNRLMIHQLMGNEDAINAKAQAWQKAGLQPAQFQQWNQQFSQSFDPRAYQLLRMTPDERKTVFQGMKKSGQIEEFKKNYNAMAAAGLVPSGER